MTRFANTRKNALTSWKFKSNRVYKTTDNLANSIECEWQNRAGDIGYEHISIFCSFGEFASHITDLLRDYRYDKYEFDQSPEVNETLFRYYSRVLLIASEILTDFQDLYILANNQLTTKGMRRLSAKSLRVFQTNARQTLAGNSKRVSSLLDFINRVCKHKTSNFHICNNHISYLFEDFHLDIKQNKGRIEIGNINNFTSYEEATFVKFSKANYLVVPALSYVIDILINCYGVVDKLFRTDDSKFEFICTHFVDR